LAILAAEQLTITCSPGLQFICGSGRHKAVGELPAHEHDVTCSNNGLHQHTIDIYNDEGRDAPYVAGAAGGIKGSPSTSETGNHSHTISINKTGGNFAHNNMQPYLSCYMWKRTN
jgi:microcystin-dependent protein